MIQFDKRELTKSLGNTDYVRDTYEKVIRLVDILDYIHQEEFLFNNLALKGGTAINLTLFDLPRLSVDIDLDYIHNTSKEEMMMVRERIRRIFLMYFERNGYQLADDSRFHHALDSFKIFYVNAGGNKDSIKLDINYISRCHIYEPIIIQSKNYGMIKSITIKTLHPYEMMASKINALMTRATPRDLYDVYHMIETKLFSEKEMEIIKKCTLFYIVLNGQDESSFSFSNMDKISMYDVKRFLLPLLGSKEKYELEKQKKCVKDYFSQNFTLTSKEKEFIHSFSQGIYKPELLFDDEEILNRISNHPLILWRLKVPV